MVDRAGSRIVQGPARPGGPAGDAGLRGAGLRAPANDNRAPARRRLKRVLGLGVFALAALALGAAALVY